jgi:hypothetical protein
MEPDFISPTEYQFIVKIIYDTQEEINFVFTSMVDALKRFESFTDCGEAEEFATYVLVEPNLRQLTKTIYKDGRVAIK